MKNVFLWVAFSLASLGPTFGQQQIKLAPEKLDKLDSCADITKQTTGDRLSKVLLPIANEILGEKDIYLVTKTLDEAVVGMCQGAGAQALIVGALKDGDALLADSLKNALIALNLPSATAAAVVEKWATSGGDETLASLLGNAEGTPDVSSALAGYFRNADDDWVKLSRGVTRLVFGAAETGRQSLAVAVANATGETMNGVMAHINKAKQGDFRELWNLTADSKKILTSRGALARAIMEQQTAEGSFYEAGWGAVCNKIAGSGPLTKEYMRGTERMTPLLDAYVTCLRDALRDDKRDGLVAGILLGAEIPSSRFRWMAEELSGVSFQALGDKLSTERDAKRAKDDMSVAIAKCLDKDGLWGGALLWHLTRPAEAVALSTRMALSDSLAGDETFSKDYIKYGAPLGIIADGAVELYGGYSYYPGGRLELMKKCETGEVKREALLRLNKAIAEALLADDKAWDNVLIEGDASGWLKKVVIDTVSRVPSAGACWAQTMTKNDPSLAAGFTRWLAENKALPEEEGNVNRWLSSVAVSASSGQSFGNADVARFKKLFSEFLATPEGWKLARRRLLLEGAGFPGVLRGLLSRTITGAPNDFWKLFKILTASNGDSMARLRPELSAYIEASRLPKMILDEAAAQNAFAADASAPLWRVLLEPDGKAVQELRKTMQDVKVMTSPFALGNLCMIETVASEEGWERAGLVAPALLEKIRYLGGKTEGDNDKDRLIYALTNHAGACSWVYSTLLGDKDFREAWAGRVMSKVLYMGKAPAIAWLFVKNDELFALWKQEMGLQVSKDPYVLRAFIDSLVTRRIGDSAWQEQVDAVKYAVSRAVFGDRILVEQMLGYPGMEYRKTLNQKVNEIFGGYVADKWQGGL